MKKRILLVLTTVLCLFLTACGGKKEEAKNEPITIKLAHYAELGHPADIAANQFAEKVKERTNGEVIIEIYPANQLGSPNEVLEQNVLGTIDMSLPTQGHLSKYSKKFATVMLPFAFKDYDHAHKVLDGPFLDWVKEDLDKQNLVYLSNWEWGFRNITNSVRKIETPADVRGLKLRTPPEIQLQAAMEALGAQTEQISFNELITSLSTGAVDGQENPLSVIYQNRLFETQKYLTLTSHVYNSMSNVISKKTWEKLDEKQQAILKEESVASGNLMRKLIFEKENELLEKLKEEGMEVTVPNKKLFSDQMEPAYKRIEKIYGKENVEKFLEFSRQTN